MYGTTTTTYETTKTNYYNWAYKPKCDYCNQPVDKMSLIKVDGADICPDCYEKTGGARNTGVPGYEDFEKILKLSQPKLKRYLKKRLRRMGYDPVLEDGYLYAKGEVPVLLIAHLDTVHEQEPETINTTDGVVWSPQGIGGDDRCGVYAILRIVKEQKCSVLFCEDEEIGCVGAGKFAETALCKEAAKDINFMVEIDRKGNNDLVFYSNGNTAFKNWCEKVTGYTTSWGTCSDISKLMPAMNRAGVNISAGYYDEHTLSHTIVLSDLEKTIEAVTKLATEEISTGPFHYIASYSYGYGRQYGKWDDYYDDYDGYSYGASSYYGSNKKEEKTDDVSKYGINPDLDVKGKKIMWYTTDGSIMTTTVYGITEASIFGNFFLTHPKVCYEDIFSFEEV